MTTPDAVMSRVIPVKERETTGKDGMHRDGNAQLRNRTVP